MPDALALLVAAVRNSDGDIVRVHSALVDAKARMRALIKDCVPLETAINAFCLIHEKHDRNSVVVEFRGDGDAV